MMENAFTEQELLGVLPAIKYDQTAPFPIGDIKVKAQVVTDGKIVPLGDTWMDVPKLDKW
jgi:hypothetical protein